MLTLQDQQAVNQSEAIHYDPDRCGPDNSTYDEWFDEMSDWGYELMRED